MEAGRGGQTQAVAVSSQLLLEAVETDKSLIWVWFRIRASRPC